MSGRSRRPITFCDYDCSTLARRLKACEDEVDLNQVLAPGIYRGFVPITVDRRGRRRLGGPGRAVEWAVHMRRLPASAAADRRLDSDRLGTDHLARITARLVAFHRAGNPARAADGPGSPAVLAENLERLSAWTRHAVGRVVDAAECRRLEARLRAYLDRHRDRLSARLEAGYVRDLHGDLRLDHVYLNRDTVTIVDRLELGTRFRVVDVAADVASLALDLEERGHKDLAAAFVDDYARRTGDDELPELTPFYAAYGACRRSCLLATLARDAAAAVSARARAARHARRFFLVALAAADPS